VGVGWRGGGGGGGGGGGLWGVGCGVCVELGYRMSVEFFRESVRGIPYQSVRCVKCGVGCV
jgi:hypothetical protein